MPRFVVVPKFRILLIALLLVASIITLFSSGLAFRWYGQVIGDTFRIESRLLSNFRGESTFLKAFVVLPISYREDNNKKFPVLYHFHGFGADYQDAASQASRLRSNMRRHPEIELIHVFLDVSLGDGYHYFVNSKNTGPWESALLEEFIPEFERTFPAIPTSSARFLTGHSSGGWTALWLQVNHPDFFGGVWSVSPDPVDFSDFFGVNLSAESNDNFYKDNLGRDRKVSRSGKQKKLSVSKYVAIEEEDIDSHCDSDFGSYECAFSPKDTDGNPSLLFDRGTGSINKETATAWYSFDISQYIKNNWVNLKPILDDKIHLFCGSEDDYFLDRPFKKFCDLLRLSELKGSCELVEGRGHGNIYFPTRESPFGLSFRIEKEARAMYEKLKK